MNHQAAIQFRSIHEKLKEKKMLSFIIPIILVVVFHRSIEIFLSTVFVKPLLSNVDSSWVNDSLLLIITIYTLSYFITRSKQFISSKPLIVIEIIISLTYLYYRFEKVVWTFTPLKLIPYLNYFDYILIFTIINGATTIICLYKAKDSLLDFGLFDDAPLGKNKPDELGYEPYAKNLVEQILKTNTENSIAIGINGKWGSGKSSFFDLIKRNIDEDKTIIVDFDPWNAYDAKAIIKDFFETVQLSLQPYHSQLPKLMSVYADKLINLDSGRLGKILKEVKNLFTPTDSLNSLYDQINTAIKKIDKKIVIFIDDVDRLDKNEIAEVIRLIRNTASFNNTFFIVAYDRNYVLYALKQLNAYNHQNFLEKIFQIEINLPYFETEKLQQQLVTKLKTLYSEKFHKVIELEILGTKSSKPNYFRGWMETLRDVTRLANGLNLNLEKIANEVVFSEFIRLELLRQKFPAIYEVLYKQKDDFLVNSDNENNKGYILKKSQSSDKISEMELFIKANNELLGVQENEIDKVIDLIDGLFGSNSLTPRSRFKSHLSVVSPNRFNLYFANYLLEGLLSEADFEQARLGSINEFYRKIDHWFETDLSFEVYRRLLFIKTFNNKADFENVIQAIFYFSRKTISGKPYGFEDKNLADKLSDYKDKISKKFYKNDKEEYSNFMRSLLKEAKSPFTFEANFLEHLNKSFEDSFPLKQEERLKIAFNYFRLYIDNMLKWTGTIWELFHACSYKIWSETGKSTYSSVTQYPRECKDIIKQAIRKDSETFLQHIIMLYQFTDNMWYLSEVVLTIFDSYDNFEEELSNLIEVNSLYYIEFKGFFAKFKEEQFKNAVEFDFAIIPVRRKDDE